MATPQALFFTHLGDQGGQFMAGGKAVHMDSGDGQALAEGIALPQLKGQMLTIEAGHDAPFRQKGLFDQMAQLKRRNTNQ